MSDAPAIARPATPRLRVFYFSTWAKGLQPIAEYLAQLSSFDVRSRVSDPKDPELVKMAQLDCDWYGENARVFDALAHPHLHFLPAQLVGAREIIDLLQRAKEKPADESWWFLLMGHQPQSLAGTWAKLGPMLNRLGIKLFFYAFDEASRAMACFNELAPFLSVYVHDESPINPDGSKRLPPHCLTLHRSWVANFTPFAAPFEDDPEKTIIFLGSQLGLTPHRKRQVEFLQKRFKDRFKAFHDHSVPVSERTKLNRYKVSVCPEGRKFATPAMSATHTDRPFWSGCLGMVPVSENSAAGDRLEALHQANLILRYEHADLVSLGDACEKALALSQDERRRIYTHFNQEETVGKVVVDLLARVELKG